MNFRIRSVVVAIVLAVGLSVSGLAAPSAHAAPKPKLTTAKVTTTFDTSVGSYTYTYVKPKLSGVKSSVKKKVEKEINAFFASAISLQKTFVDDDLLCVPSTTRRTRRSAESSRAASTSRGIFRCTSRSRAPVVETASGFSQPRRG